MHICTSRHSMYIVYYLQRALGVVQDANLHICCVKLIMSESTFAHPHTCLCGKLQICKSVADKHVNLLSSQDTLALSLMRMWLSVLPSSTPYFLCCRSGQISLQTSIRVRLLLSSHMSEEHQCKEEDSHFSAGCGFLSLNPGWKLKNGVSRGLALTADKPTTSVCVNCNHSIGPNQIHWRSPGEQAERLLV